jgi:hypothetical protein
MATPDNASGHADLPQLSETRHITFGKDALIHALTSYSAATKQPLPPGIVQSCTILAKPDLSVSLVILSDASGTLEKRVIPAEIVGAAMIRYCRLVKVPLPRTSEKSLVSAGDNLVLLVHVRSTQTQLARTESQQPA